MSKPIRLMLLLLSCPLCGAVYALAAVASLVLFGNVIGGRAEIDAWVADNVVGLAKMGMICGVISIVYVLPLLAPTRLPRSAYRMFVVTLAASALSGPTLIGAPFCALIAHIGVCMFEHRRARRPPRRGVCASCDYSLTGLPSPICPECGTDTSFPRPG